MPKKKSSKKAKPGFAASRSTSAPPAQQQSPPLDQINQVKHLAQQGKYEEAIALSQSILERSPANSPHLAPVHHLLGMLALQQQEFAAALSHLEQAIQLDGSVAEFHNHAGVACFRLGQMEAGITHYEQAVSLQPDALDSRYNLALGLNKADRHTDAVPHFATILEQEPHHISALYQLGNSLQQQQQFQEAIARYQQAIDLCQQTRIRQSPLNRQFPVKLETLWYNLGVALQELEDLDAARDAYHQAIALNPHYGEALSALGTILEKQEDLEGAIALYQQARKLLPDYLPLLANLGNAQLRQHQWQDAEQCFRRILELQPDNLKAIDGLLKLSLQTCQWQDLESLTQRLWELGKDQITTDITIYSTLYLDLTPHQLQVIAQNYAIAIQRRLPTHPGKPSPGPSQGGNSPTTHPPTQPTHPSNPLTLAYLSGDYRNQAVAHLIYRLFELHDRQHFQVYAYSLGPDDGSDYRRKFETDADVFRDVRGWKSDAIAQQIRDDGIDILIDLEGYTEYAQLEIYAHRPAPLIVAYLGHPGTMGANYIDYQITDPIITPHDQEQHFTEQCLYLPECYQLNNDQRALPRANANRAEFGLPENAFVFCGFSKVGKYEPHGFALWMRILAQVPNSVLWLKGANPEANTNLRQFAIAHGIDGDRLIFAPSLPVEEHITRHECADLFLDTIIFSGHVTASDALWAGLPIITCPRDTFVSRVAASLLTTLGLPELIVNSLEDYERLAVHLATHPAELQSLRQRLHQNRHTSPLFNSERTVRHLETAYQMIWDNYQSGNPPRMMQVPLLEKVSEEWQVKSEDDQIGHQPPSPPSPPSPPPPPLHQQALVALKNHQPDLALNYLEQALAVAPDMAELHNHIGVVYFQLGRTGDGLAHYQRAVELQPDALDIRYNLAIALQKADRHAEAIPQFAALLHQEPNLLAARYQLGNALQKQGLLADAIAQYRRVIEHLADPAITRHVINRTFTFKLDSLWHNLGVALEKSYDAPAATQAFQQALSLNPQHIDALVGLAGCWQRSHQWQEAINLLHQARTLKPDDPELLLNLGNLHIRLHQWDAAETCFRQVLEQDPEHLKAIDSMVQLASQTCQWDVLEPFTQRLWDIGKDRISTDIAIYSSLFLPFTPHQLKVLAQNHAIAIQQHLPTHSPTKLTHLTSPPTHPLHPLHIAYISGDYRTQAVATQIYRLFELHDRQHFRVYAYSLGPDDGSENRRKFEVDADIFRDVQHWSAARIAEQIRADGIQILIDLEGYTEYARPEIYALRPAPLILSYLGHAGTMGADYIDYIITDWAISPPEQIPHLVEKCLYLPVSGLITNNHQPLAVAPDRAELGLPRGRFVFCGFHKIQKIEPTVFAIWMRILHQVPDSVLWLLEANDRATQNLRSAAEQAGIEGDRLIFAPRVSREKYLANLQCADLFLDSLYMNAYATGLDILWAGVPLLTRPGQTVASRVAASFLMAVDLPELITANLEDYEALAVHLATHPEQLQSYRQRLAHNREHSDLFNPERTVRSLEAGYHQIWVHYQAGNSPKHMQVTTSGIA